MPSRRRRSRGPQPCRRHSSSEDASCGTATLDLRMASRHTFSSTGSIPQPRSWLVVVLTTGTYSRTPPQVSCSTSRSSRRSGALRSSCTWPLLAASRSLWCARASVGFRCT
ncbi:hypothetical protein NFJ02_37g94480 [Pycnococcus provasolii]